MIAGTRESRTTNASTRTPNASAKPIDLMIGSSTSMKPANTEIMISAGGHDDPGAVAHAGDDGGA